MPDLKLYEGREQTYVKHYILEKYLESFAPIIGSWRKTITYVDCFSGPWESNDSAFADTSFGIAVKVLRAARDDFARRGASIRLRCFFLEKNSKAYAQLKQFAAAAEDIEIETRNKVLRDAVGDIIHFIRAAGDQNFTFIFVDPTGWTGFPLKTITPLLQVTPGEVLINFMTEHIRRFVDSSDEELRAGFRQLFDEEIDGSLFDLPAQEREEKLVGRYLRGVKKAGNFRYVGLAIVFKPEIEKTFFHLLYGTRNDKGIDVFKKVEQGAMKEAEKARAAAKERKDTSGQTAFLDATEMHPSTRMHQLRDRYLDAARARVLRELERRGEVKYNRLWRIAVAWPLVWESDLRGWLKDWKVQFSGLLPRQKPRWDRDINVIWPKR
ncbi:MAG TPA: three-Cys-motif partner protein TcmP [Thermoanaerobaculia bacterium]|nr:three-Cys-motif partner protein TcmP [Thermoanaerobaculia bacterium]